MASKRQRPNGTIELRITHQSLSKPFYTTHQTDADADAYAAHILAMLDRGEVPPELQEVKAQAQKKTPVSVVIKEYEADSTAGIAKSDYQRLSWLRANIKVSTSEITVLWVNHWITGMKREEKLAPGTIRKRVESLARVLDWWNRKHYGDGTMPANPLRTLPRGYSSYTVADKEVAGVVREDTERNRRLEPGELDRIEAVILGKKRQDRQRALDMPDRESFLLLLRLLVNTGLRLREAYTLSWVNIKFNLKTIHVSKISSKTGDARDVPMTRHVYELMQTAKQNASGDYVFPFWDGTEADLAPTTSRLSWRFGSLFSYADCEDLKEHDLRHEATCRWMEMKDANGQWMFRAEEVRKITGHKTDRVFQRYLSLRGSDLANRLW